MSMDHIKRIFIPGTVVMLLLLATLFIFTSRGAASSGGDFDLVWFTMDAGGGTSTGGNFALSATIGQPDAGEMDSGALHLQGGFWGVFAKPVYRLFMPLVGR
jgi:hypothetical protein